MTIQYPYPSLAISDLEIPENSTSVRSGLEGIANTNGNQNLDAPEEYHAAAGYLKNLIRAEGADFQTADGTRRRLFQLFVEDFHNPRNRAEGDSETKVCHEQILGCYDHEDSIFVVSEDDQTIYEYHLGVDDYTSHDNLLLTRRDVLSGEVVTYVLDDPDLQYIHSLGTDGKNIFGLIKSKSNGGYIVGQFLIGTDTAEIRFHLMNRRDSGFWKSASIWSREGVHCSTIDFYRGTDDRFKVECEGFGDSWRNFDLTLSSFTHSATQMVALNEWQYRDPYQERKDVYDLTKKHDSFKDFLLWCVDVYTSGNKHYTGDVGIAHLRDELKAYMRIEDILILVAVINNLSETGAYQDSIDPKKIKETLSDIDDKALMAFALRCNETYRQNFPKNYGFYENEFDRIVELFCQSEKGEPAPEPVAGLVRSQANSNWLPAYNYGSLRELLDAHMGFFTDEEFPEGLFELARSTSPLHCDFSGRPKYRAFAENDSALLWGRPFSDAQLNVILAFIDKPDSISEHGGDDDYSYAPEPTSLVEKQEALDSMDDEEILSQLHLIIDEQQDGYRRWSEETLHDYGKAIDAIAELEALRYYFQTLTN